MLAINDRVTTPNGPGTVLAINKAGDKVRCAVNGKSHVFHAADVEGASTKFVEGDIVTGVPGRASHGWHGRVENVSVYETGIARYLVYWQERAESKDHAIARYPAIAMREDQIQMSPIDGIALTA